MSKGQSSAERAASQAKLNRIAKAARSGVIANVPYVFAKRHPAFLEKPWTSTLVSLEKTFKNRRVRAVRHQRSLIRELGSVFPEVQSYSDVRSMVEEMNFTMLVGMTRVDIGLAAKLLAADFNGDAPSVTMGMGYPLDRAVSNEVLTAIDADHGEQLSNLLIAVHTRATELFKSLGSTGVERSNDDDERSEEFQELLAADTVLNDIRFQIYAMTTGPDKIFDAERAKHLQREKFAILRIVDSAKKIEAIDTDINELQTIWRTFRYSAVGQQIAEDIESETTDMFEFGRQFLDAQNRPYLHLSSPALST